MSEQSYRNMSPIERFATYLLEQPLYDYQVEAANAILHSIDNGLGWIVTVAPERQESAFRYPRSILTPHIKPGDRRRGYEIKIVLMEA